MKLTNQQLFILLGAGALAFLYLKNKTVEAVQEVGTAINPVNPENIFYSGVNEVGEALTGNESFSLGSWIYDKLNTEENL